MTRGRATARRAAPKPARKAAAKPKGRAAAKRRAAAKPTRQAAAKPVRKAAAKRKAVAKPARKAAAKRAAPKSRKPAGRQTAAVAAARWPKFVAKHGVVLASARGPVPNVAEAIAGEPIVGSWWSHGKAHEIFDALSAIDDDADIRCFKLIDHKITFVHRRLWPALACLARAGALAPDRVAWIRQEHTPTGAHRNLSMPFPQWAPPPVLEAAGALSLDEAHAQLGPLDPAPAAR